MIRTFWKLKPGIVFGDLLAADDDIIEAVKHVVCIGGGNQLCSRGQSVSTPVRPLISGPTERNTRVIRSEI